MGQINVEIADDLEKRFRVKVAQLGGKKGSLKDAMTEAMEDWIRKGRKS